MSTQDVDFLALKLIAHISVDAWTPSSVLDHIRPLVEAGPPEAVTTALAGHANTFLTGLAVARGRTVRETLEEYTDVATLARLRSELEDGESHDD